jgi:hypothetical protein
MSLPEREESVLGLNTIVFSELRPLVVSQKQLAIPTVNCARFVVLFAKDRQMR